MKQVSPEKVTYITPKGLEKLKNELDYLRILKRREIAKYLQDTMGDVEDNEYLLALEEQAFVEGRIRRLEQILSDAQVIRLDQNHQGVIEIGSTVILREGDIASETYTIVGAAEADPQMGMISNESPLGKALLGRKIGDDLEIKVPAGLLKFHILAVQ